MTFKVVAKFADTYYFLGSAQPWREKSNRKRAEVSAAREGNGEGERLSRTRNNMEKEAREKREGERGRRRRRHGGRSQRREREK